MYLDLMEIWVRFNHLSVVLLSCPAILFAIGLQLFNKAYRKNHPKPKTKNEQIKNLTSCIENLQEENDDYKKVIAELAKANALMRIEKKNET